MPRSRSRSRGRGDRRSRSNGRQEPPKTNKADEVIKSVKEGSSESDIVNVAIKQLPAKIRDRLEKLFEEGLLKDNDLDLRSVTVFASLNEGLQDRVMTHLETERIYVANARSKSGFLIATCDKAKTGCLDARGLGAIDPWRSALVAMATPKQKMFDLESERDWIEKYGSDPVKINVNVKCCQSDFDSEKVTVEVPLSDTSAALKSKLVSMGAKIATNKMKIYVEPVGFLKDSLPLAYYNIVDGIDAELSIQKRAGVRYRKDHAVPQKRPKTQDKQVTASNPLDFIKQAQGGGAPAAPGLDLKASDGLKDQLAALTAAKAGLPGLSSLPALPGLPGLPGLGTTPGAPAAPKLGGLPGLGGFPGLGGLPGLSGLSLPGGTMPSLGLGGTMPSLGLGGTMPSLGLGGTMPSLGLGGTMPSFGGLGAPPPALAGLGGSTAAPPMTKSSGAPPLAGLGAVGALGAPMTKGGGAPAPIIAGTGGPPGLSTPALGLTPPAMPMSKAGGM